MTDLLERLLDLAVAIQQVPAPTFHEEQRAGFVRAQFEKEALAGVTVDDTGNVHARLPGRDAADRPVVVSAHLDTVFPLSVDLTTRREGERIIGPGIGDNALGVAGLLGLVWRLRERDIQLPFDVHLVANVCEEGLGNLRGIQAVVERFGETPRGYIILEGSAFGNIYHRALGVRRYRIQVRTEGGHSWVDYGRPSAVHELAALLGRITALKLPAEPRTTLNAGIISGGTSVNTIAAEASLELDLRSEDAGALTDLAGRVESLCQAASRPGVSVENALIGLRPAGEIPETHPLVQQAQACLRALGVSPVLRIGSTDANIPLSRGLAAVTVGLTTGFGAHTVHEYIHTRPLEKGLEQVVQLVSNLP
jgi:tripeptide aminopeptidase